MALPRYFDNWGNYSERAGNRTLGDMGRVFTPTQWDTYSPTDPSIMQQSLDVLAENDFWLFNKCSGDYPFTINRNGEPGSEGYIDVSGEDYRSSNFNPEIVTRNTNGSIESECHVGLVPVPKVSDRRQYFGVDRNGSRWMNTDEAQVFELTANGQPDSDFSPYQYYNAGSPSGARYLKKPVYIPCDSGFNGFCLGEHCEDGYLKFGFTGGGYICDVTYPQNAYISPSDPETDPNGCILDIYLNDYLLGSTKFGIQDWDTESDPQVNKSARGILNCEFIVPAAAVNSGYLTFRKRNEATAKPLIIDTLSLKVERFHTTN